MTEYVINKKFKSTVERTERVLEIGQAFGLGLNDKEFVIYDDLKINVEDGDVVYIHGQSGSGKTIILNELANQMLSKTVAMLDDMKMDMDRPLIDQVGKDMTEALKLLSLAGLNDAYLFVRKPGELSDGQKYRFRLAKLIESGAKVWVADEFGAVLDRVTAKVVAYNMQKMARKVGATLMIATTHDDLMTDLNPDLYIHKNYRDKVEVSYGLDE